MPKMLEFATEAELVEWVDTHDTAPYLDEMEDAEEIFVVHRTQFTTKPLDVRVRSDLYQAIETVATQRGIPYQMLVQEWLREKIVQEAPELILQPN